MPIYEFTTSGIVPLDETSFEKLQVYERSGLQRLLREKISIIAPEVLIISEEYEISAARYRIDLLGVDINGNLVVFELKRQEPGSKMELQALRYASWVSNMTFDQSVEVYDEFLKKRNSEKEARSDLLDFLGWNESDGDMFAQNVRIVLVAENFSSELTASVLWLNDQGTDIRCVQLTPYIWDSKVLVDVQEIIPLRQESEFQLTLRDRNRKRRERQTSGADYTRYNLQIGERNFPALPKRRVVYIAFRNLVDSGIDVEKVASHCGMGLERLLLYVDGWVEDENEFALLAADKREHEGKNFDPIRFFCKSDELIASEIGGEKRTYAFYSQWGGDKWETAMNNLKNAYPDHEIRFDPVE